MQVKFSKRLLGSIALLLAAMLLMVQTVSAHARLIKSEPAPGAVLGTAPGEVRLWYDEDVDVNFSQVQVLDKNLARVDNGDLKAVPADSKQLVITLKTLSDGTYTVAWQVLSSTDGHVTRGNFAFSVGNVAGPVIAPAAPTISAASETDPFSVLVRWLNLLAMLALVGTLFFRVMLLERSLRAVPVPATAEASVWATWRQLTLAAFVVALLTTLAGLLLEASLAGNVPLANLASSDALPRTLMNTRFGTLWIARVIVLIAVGLSLLVRVGFARWTGALLGLGLLLTISLGGHGAAAAGFISPALAADWLHLAGVAVWVGGLFNLFAVTLTLWRTVKADNRARWIAWMVPRFSAVAIPTTAVIALTGLYSSLLEIPSIDSLVRTGYGETLVVKVALFGVMIAFGAINLLLLSPRFRRAVNTPEHSAKLFSRFRLTVGAEALLGMSAIFLAGLLTLEPPARSSIEQQNVPAVASVPAAPQSVVLVDSAATDVQVTLTLSPTLESPTTFDVYLSNPQLTQGTPAPGNSIRAGTPITNALRVMIQFTLLDQDFGLTNQIAASKGDGHYVVNGSYLTVPGMWRMHVVVRRAGVDDVTVDFPVYQPRQGAPTTAGDPRALELLKTSEAAMNQLQSLRSQQDLNDGANGVVITDYEYHAPDALRFDVRGQAQSIAIGPVQYYQDKNGNWTERQRVDPFVFPQFNASAQAQDVQLGRPEVLNGEDAQIVRYVIPDASGGSGTQFAQWISTQDHRLIQLAMVALSHFMMQYYSDYDSPQIAIAAPANAVRETAVPVAAPANVPAAVTTRPKGPITGDLEADLGLGMLVLGVAVGLVASGSKRVKRQRLVLLGVSVLAILGSMGVVIDAFNGMAAAAANAPVDTSLAAQGKALYDNNCATCHGATGHGDGPAGKNLPVKPFDLTTHVLLHDEQYLDAVISNGRGYMPAWKDKLTQDQIFAIIAYTRLLARNARQESAPGFTPGASSGFTPQPGFTPAASTPQPGFTPAASTPSPLSLTGTAITSPTPGAGGLVQSRTIGDLVVSVNIQPRVYQPTDVEIRLNDLDGNPVRDVQSVDIAMAMDGMNHGAVGIAAAPASPGVYRAHAMLLAMAGPSFMALRIERADGRRLSSVFHFSVPEDVQTGVVDPLYTRPADPVQIQDVAVYPDSILPRQVKVTANHPVRLEIVFVNQPPCGQMVSFGQLRTDVEATPEGLAELAFVPTQNGTLELTCSPSGLEVREGS